MPKQSGFASYHINASTVLTIGFHDGLVKVFVLFHDDDFQAPLSHTKVFKSTESEPPLLLPTVAIIEGYTCCQTFHERCDIQRVLEYHLKLFSQH